MSSDDPRPALSAFSSVRRGMNREAIESRIGPALVRTAGGAQVLDYRLSDGSRVEILYVHPQLIKIVHYRVDGTRMTWIPT
jgi:hypothetical protein